MSTRPRYHDLGARDQVRGNEIQQVARALARILGAQNRHDEWREQSWRRLPRQRGPWRSEPRRFERHQPRAAPPRAPRPWNWRPWFDMGERPEWSSNKPQDEALATTGGSKSCQGEDPQ